MIINPKGGIPKLSDRLVSIVETDLKFYVGGSWFFGCNTETSDVDFYAKDSPEMIQFLGVNGFFTRAQQGYDTPFAVYKHQWERVGVLVLPDMYLKALLHFQDTLFKSGDYKAIYDVPSGPRKAVLRPLYKCAIEAMVSMEKSPE